MENNNRIWYLAALDVIIFASVVFIITRTPFSTWLDIFIRGIALYAYLLLFITVISSNFMKELKNIFGKSFMTVHHITGGAALSLMILHPLAVAYQYKTFSFLIPQTSSFGMFFSFAGAPALYLILAAVLTAIYSRVFKKSWRKIHLLNYAAFILITVHGLLIGTDFQIPAVRISAYLMLAGAIAGFIMRRYTKYSQRKAKG